VLSSAHSYREPPQTEVQRMNVPAGDSAGSDRVQSSLARKGFILLLIPALVQLVLLIGLFLLSDETALYPRRAVHDRQNYDCMSRYFFNVCTALRLASSAVATLSQIDPRLDSRLWELRDSAAKLESFWREYPARHAALVLFPELVHENTRSLQSNFEQRAAMIEKTTQATLAAVDLAKQAGFSADRQELPLRRQAFSRAAHEVASVRLWYLAFSESQSEHAASPYVALEIRQYWMLALTACSLVNLAFLVLIGLFFTQQINSRLMIMIDNNARLAGNQKLNPVLGGNDEIARLDAAFHDMAIALKESTHSYMSMIANAQDLICSMDGQGRFMLVSPSSAKVLGTHSESLAGTWLLDIVADGAQEATAARLLEIVNKGSQGSFETTLLRADGSPVEMLCSASSSPVDKTTFCVAHDVSQKKAAERLQKEVMQMVSHDLRSPLAAIAAFHEKAEAGAFGKLSLMGEKQIKVCRRSTQRMLMLVNDLIEAERMESGKLELERTSLDLDSVIEHCRQAVALAAEARGVQVLAFPCRLSVFADENRLLQVLVNLLTNAIKFSPKDGKVAMSAFMSGRPDFVRIQVKDEGRGVPLELQSSIFDRFKQVQASDATARGGTGLGLAICKALVELHGGRIAVESEPGRGSTFFFEIPAREPGVAAVLPSEGKFGEARA
jgi:PAS domain S-box-containing protein